MAPRRPGAEAETAWGPGRNGASSGAGPAAAPSTETSAAGGSVVTWSICNPVVASRPSSTFTLRSTASRFGADGSSRR
jgi:hypothetical protein